MNDQTVLILFWVSFVGFVFFVINSIHNTIVLRHLKTKEYPTSEFVFTTIFLFCAILFASLSLDMGIHHTHPEQQIIYPTPQPTELHIKIGEIVQYDSINKTYDTVELFKLLK